MASVNAQTRELAFKIVYCGPGLSGKTTTLQHIHATVRPEHRGKMVSLATPVDRTLYFDFLPIRLPRVREMITKLVVTAFESSIPPGERQLTADIEAIEGGLSEALRNAESGEAAEPPSVIASLTVPPAGGVSPPSSVPPGHGRPDRGAEAP